MPIYDCAAQLIGHTPVVRLRALERARGLDGQLLAKLESFNPAGSAKDRVGLYLIEDAEKRGLLKPGGVIVEPTSGNTGIGLASVAAARGYRVILTMPDTMSRERIGLLRAYGAEVVLTEGKRGMAGAIAKAEALRDEIPGAFLPGQFTNPANPRAHYETTGPELYEQVAGRIDCFVAGVGTGGTITGVGRYLKQRNPAIFILAVEPARSPVLSGGAPGPHGLQGIGAGFVPEVLDRAVIDEIARVSDEDARDMARLIARREGVLAGISGGAALWAACAWLEARPGKVVAALLPDSGERYLSSGLYE
ncbi:MAG: cysteine synthase A [Clostridia bacterium]